MSTTTSTDEFPLTEKVRAARTAIQNRWSVFVRIQSDREAARKNAFWLWRPSLWIAHQLYALCFLSLFPVLWLQFLLWWILRAIFGVFCFALLIGLLIGGAGWLFGWFEHDPDYTAYVPPPTNTTSTSSTSTPAYEPSYTYPSPSYSNPTHSSPQPQQATDGFSRFLNDHPQELQLAGELLKWGLEQKFGGSGSTNPSQVWHSDSNGSGGHWQTAPNGNPNDNFSTRGNVNPYTGERGYK